MHFYLKNRRVIKREIGSYQNYSDRGLIDLVQNHHDQKAYNALVLRYLDLVIKIAKKNFTGPNTTELEDLINTGILALIIAIKKHDPLKGQFNSYAKIMIRFKIIGYKRNFISKFVSNEKWATFNKINKVLNELITELYKKNGNISPDSLKDFKNKIRELKIKIPEIDNILKKVETILISRIQGNIDFGPMLIQEYYLKLWKTIHRYRSQRESSIDNCKKEDIKQSQLTNKTLGTETEIVKQENRMDIQRALLELSATDHFVIINYYYKDMTMKEIGNLINLTESRISQIHSRTLKKLKTILSKDSSANEFFDAEGY